MLILADESCDFGVVRALRADGHDVVAICERSPGAADRDILEQAVSEHRIVFTEDKDFGQLVYAHGQKSLGVVLIRYPGNARQRLTGEVRKLVDDLGDKLVGAFVVLQPGRVRISAKE